MGVRIHTADTVIYPNVSRFQAVDGKLTPNFVVLHILLSLVIKGEEAELVFASVGNI